LRNPVLDARAKAEKIIGTEHQSAKPVGTAGSIAARAQPAEQGGQCLEVFNR